MSRHNPMKAARAKLEKIAIDKVAVNEALQEWLDRKWDETCRRFGAWSFRLIVLIIFFLFVKFVFWAHAAHLINLEEILKP